MVSRASAVGCHPLREVPSLRGRGSYGGGLWAALAVCGSASARFRLRVMCLLECVFGTVDAGSANKRSVATGHEFAGKSTAPTEVAQELRHESNRISGESPRRLVARSFQARRRRTHQTASASRASASPPKSAASMPWKSQKRLAGCKTSVLRNPWARTQWSRLACVLDLVARQTLLTATWGTVCPLLSIVFWLKTQAPGWLVSTPGSGTYFSVTGLTKCLRAMPAMIRRRPTKPTRVAAM